MSQITKNMWIDVFTTFCRDCYHFHKQHGSMTAEAFDKAREETLKIRRHPFVADGEPVSHEALSEWGETYSQHVVETLYRYEQSGELEDLRICNHCGFPIFEGYYLGGEYACCEQCAVELYQGDKEQFQQDLRDGDDPNNPMWDEVYWSQWTNPIND